MIDQEQHECYESGCTNTNTTPCYLPDVPNVPVFYYCFKHAKPHGFCFGCGELWGGIEDFDFARWRGGIDGYCPNCSEGINAGIQEDDYEDDGDYLM